MIYGNDCTLPKEYLEQFINQGLEGLPDLIRVMVNEAMQIERENYLGARLYERSQERQGHANGYALRAFGKAPKGQNALRRDDL